MKLVIQAFGEQEVSRQLLRFAASAEDMIPAFDAIRDDFHEVERRQFEGQGIGPSGNWAPLAESTVNAKARLGIDPRIMFGETGNLFRSLTDSGDSDAVYEVSPDRAFMGSKVDYGKYHQSREPRKRLPRRPLVDLDEATKVRWMKILQRHLVGAV